MARTPAAAIRASAGPARRTQADRSAGTRAALEEAAIDLLVEQGWAAVTAVEACHRAGVTRGAFHHHYDDLPNLLAAALRRLYAEMRDRPVVPVHDLVGVVDATWRHMTTPRFKAVIEAWLAMANDADLRDEIGPVVAEFADLVHPDRLAPAILVDADDRARYLMAREALLGLALGRATNGGRALAHEAVVLAQVRAAVTRPA
jgi:AcrR family transcriptional regulator